MTEKISDIELNLMAEIDGEEPFFPDAVITEDSQLDANLKDAMAFSLVVKRGLMQGVAQEDVPEKWVDLVQNFEMEDESQQKRNDIERSSLVDSVRNFFSNLFAPQLAWGATFSIALLGGLFLQMQNTGPNWVEQYESISGAPRLITQSNSEFTGSFFNQSDIVFRSDEADNTSYREFLAALQTEDVSWRPSVSDLTAIEPALNAMEINNETFGRIPVGGQRAIWLAMRGDLEKSAEESFKCRLFHMTEGPLEGPELQGFGLFVSYCPQSFTSRVEFLGTFSL